MVGDYTSRLVPAQDWETGMASTMIFDEKKRSNEVHSTRSSGTSRFNVRDRVVE
jgi:hypothetical protein